MNVLVFLLPPESSFTVMLKMSFTPWGFSSLKVSSLSRLDRFFWASPFYVFSFFIILFCLVPCGRLSWLLVRFWAHVNIVHHIISYHIITVDKRATPNNSLAGIESPVRAGSVTTSQVVQLVDYSTLNGRCNLEREVTISLSGVARLSTVIIWYDMIWWTILTCAQNFFPHNLQNTA